MWLSVSLSHHYSSRSIILDDRCFNRAVVPVYLTMIAEGGCWCLRLIQAEMLSSNKMSGYIVGVAAAVVNISKRARW